MRKLLLPTLAAVLAAATAALATTGHAPGRRHHHDGAYAIGLWGDLPYASGNSDTTQLQKTVGVPNLIADMNRQRLAFSVHDGDLKTEARCARTPSTTTSRPA